MGKKGEERRGRIKDRVNEREKEMKGRRKWMRY